LTPGGVLAAGDGGWSNKARRFFGRFAPSE